jgi:hypothetical protein
LVLWLRRHHWGDRSHRELDDLMARGIVVDLRRASWGLVLRRSRRDLRGTDSQVVFDRLLWSRDDGPPGAADLPGAPLALV